jgi:GGDEF domain-containing protein
MPRARPAQHLHSWLAFTRRTLEEIDYQWTDDIHPDDREACLSVQGEAIRTGSAFSLEYRFRRHDGEYRWLLGTGRPHFGADGGLAGFVGGCLDISERRASEAQIHHLAYHDTLTGLPNRQLLLDRIGQALAEAERDSDTVARLGGDEFVILLPRRAAARAATQVATKIMRALGTPFSVQGQELTVSTTLGVSLFPKDGADAETLLKHADTALYQAKDRGRDQFQFFDPRMNAETEGRLRLEGGLRHALDQGGSCSTTSHRSSSRATPSSASRRWSAGAIPIADWWLPVSSSPSRRTPDSSWRSASGCWRRPAGRRPSGSRRGCRPFAWP